MKPNIPNILTFFLVFFTYSVCSQIVWNESFSIPEKGVWGGEDGITVHTDFSEIENWSLEFSSVSLSNSEDYAKTVSTSGGRFECRDINAEVILRSEIINISEYLHVDIQLSASETGSGKNEQNKYLKAYYKLDGEEEILFEMNGENLGNWGTKLAETKNLTGSELQIIVYMNNHYANDKVILDEIEVRGVERNPLQIEPGDVLINEILFNPFGEGSDYVEIYNHSEKTIPLNYLSLASRNTDGKLTQIYQLTDEKTKMEPNSYYALTKDTNAVFPYYTIQCPMCFIQMEKFPSFNNDEDDVVLLDDELEIIDELHYTEKMHSLLLADEEGIALERISFSEETNIFKNWYSASSESGYGTPGYKNSQHYADETSKPNVTFEPDSFSPNSDGYNDEYLIQVDANKTGYQINIKVFDSVGRFVFQVAKNENLGAESLYIWNGKDETGQKQKLGVYVIHVEIFDLNGNIYRFKDGVVLTDILE